ncbi:RYamide receptor [Frankliniella fusca]|uniref:RYamide receptor n=1 Tax=Frankliniella fusca TaxID=407009 RepID=A0AAE1HCX4_9NEOP|nr:RYamide receptor [Frankliniella fusca]
MEGTPVESGARQGAPPPGLGWAPLNWTDAVPVDCDATVPMSSTFQVAVYLMYSSVFVVALVGNGLVLYCVVSSPRMRTATNYWLLNLAVGDILMTLLCVPFSFVPTLLLQYWPFGVELCHLSSEIEAAEMSFPVPVWTRTPSQTLFALKTNPAAYPQSVRTC